MALGANDALPTTTSLTVGGGSTSGALKLNGKSQTVAGLTTSGTGTANKVVNGSATAGALTLNNSTANAFAGVLGGTGTDENNFSLTKDGAGTLTLSGASTYTGATLVSGGTLLVTGALASNISVSDNATIGGGGTVGAVSFGGGSFFDIFLAMSNPLDSTTISFSTIGFGIDNLLSQGAAVDWSIIADGTYTLINGTLSNTNLGNFGLANAYDLGSGRSAYFKNGSLQLVVIPEPAAALLGGLGLLTLLRRRR
jgi:autotransporter-associated beta strand protein